jgi:hypothetical protein
MFEQKQRISDLARTTLAYQLILQLERLRVRDQAELSNVQSSHQKKPMLSRVRSHGFEF